MFINPLVAWAGSRLSSSVFLLVLPMLWQENELEDLKELCAEQQAVIEQLHAERMQTAADMEQLAQRVQDQDADMEDQVYDAMSQVKKENKV